jgi:hypothetical protein
LRYKDLDQSSIWTEMPSGLVGRLLQKDGNLIVKDPKLLEFGAEDYVAVF